MVPQDLVDQVGYFAGHYADVWRLINPQDWTDGEVSFVASRLPRPSAVLDVMCGHGRHAQALAGRGLDVTGVDVHAWDGDAAGAGWARVVADVTTWAPERTWDAALCLGNSLTGFDRAQLISLLGRMRTWVRHDGLLIFQAWTVTEVVYRRGFEPVSFTVGDYNCELSGDVHLRPTRILYHQRILRDGAVLETLKSVHYLYSANELEALLHEAGFQVEDIFGDSDGRPFTFGDMQLLFVARAA